MTNTTSIKVGSIFKSSWGYDQTNVDYYQVTKVNPSGKSITVQQIADSINTTGMMCGTSLPIKDSFKGQPQTKRIKSYTDNNITNHYFKVTSFSCAHLMHDTSKPSYTSWYA